MTRVRFLFAAPIGLAVALAGCGGGSSGPTNGTNYPITASQIVFVSTRGGAADIYKASTDGSNALKLTNFSGTTFSNAERPSVSPDGQRIVFQFGKAATGTGTDNTEIGIVNADGSNARALTSDTAPAGRPDDYAPAFSPDGKYIFWTSTRKVGTVDKVPHIWRMDGATGAEGNNQNVFVSSPSAYGSFDKTGGALAYATPGQTTSVAVQPLAGDAIPAGSTAKTIGSSAGDSVFDVALSPDGTKVAFSVATSGTAPHSNVQTPTASTLSILNTSSGASAGSPSGASSAGGSAWSRDSATLFFDANATPTRQLFSSSATPSPAFSTSKLITTSPTGASYSPATLTGS